MWGYTFLGEREIARIEKPTPQPGPGQVLIRTRSSSICGTDLHQYRAPKERRAPFAQTMSGHEPVGEVAAVGPGVLWPAVGDRVVGYHVGGCNTCRYCQVRDYKRCPHAMDDANVMMLGTDGSNSEYLLTQAGQVLPLPDDFSWADGSVLSCNFGTAWGAVRGAHTFPGGTLAVWGLGPVGLNVLLIARALGMRVIGVDVSAGRREVAAGLGAHVLDGAAADLLDRLAELTGGEGPDSIIDTTGVASVHAMIGPAARRGGTVVLVGLGHDSMVGPVPQLVLRQITVKGSWIYDIADWPDMLQFIRDHEIDLSATVDGIRPIADFEQACADADAAQGAKILFSW